MSEPSYLEWLQHWELLLNEVLENVVAVSLCNSADSRGKGRLDEVLVVVEGRLGNGRDVLKAIADNSGWRFDVRVVDAKLVSTIQYPLEG